MLKIGLLHGTLPGWLDETIGQLSETLVRWDDDVEIIEDNGMSFDFSSDGKTHVQESDKLDGAIVILTSEESTNIGVWIGCMVHQDLPLLVLHERKVKPPILIQSAAAAGHLTVASFTVNEFMELCRSCWAFADIVRMRLESKVSEASLAEFIAAFGGCTFDGQPPSLSERPKTVVMRSG